MNSTAPNARRILKSSSLAMTPLPARSAATTKPVSLSPAPPCIARLRAGLGNRLAFPPRAARHAVPAPAEAAQAAEADTPTHFAADFRLRPVRHKARPFSLFNQTPALSCTRPVFTWLALSQWQPGSGSPAPIMLPFYRTTIITSLKHKAGQ